MNHETGAKLDHSKANGVCFRDSVTNGKNGVHPTRSKHEDFEETPLLIAVITYINYATLILFGYLRDLMRYYGLEKFKGFTEKRNEV